MRASLLLAALLIPAVPLGALDLGKGRVLKKRFLNGVSF